MTVEAKFQETALHNTARQEGWTGVALQECQQQSFELKMLLSRFDIDN